MLKKREIGLLRMLLLEKKISTVRDDGECHGSIIFEAWVWMAWCAWEGLVCWFEERLTDLFDALP